MEFRDVLADLVAGGDLPADAMRETMDALMDGKLTPAQIGAFLTALRIKGETVDEITAAAASMRAHATPVDGGKPPIVDTCGTGGDASGTFNISTTAAFIAAGAGIKVAKHGNRAASSKCGSADVLKELGVNVMADPATVGACMREVGIGFLFAPALHGAMKYAIGPRRELGMRTLFNVLGPLTNPAGATAQVIGVFDGEMTAVLAEVLGGLGSERALVVHGEDGLDEISTTTFSGISELRDGKVTSYRFDPRQLMGDFADPAALRGGDAATNATILRRILAGASGAPADIAVLNAAAAIYVGGKAEDWHEAVAAARESVRSGAALGKLEALVARSAAP